MVGDLRQQRTGLISGNLNALYAASGGMPAAVTALALPLDTVKPDEYSDE